MGEMCDIWCMTRMSEIPPELLDEMTPAVRVFVESLLAQHAAQIESLEKRIAQQEKRIAQHEAKLGTNSRNSSKPWTPHSRPLQDFL